MSKATKYLNPGLLHSLPAGSAGLLRWDLGFCARLSCKILVQSFGKSTTREEGALPRVHQYLEAEPSRPLT